MKKAINIIFLILSLVFVFSVVTTNFTYAVNEFDVNEFMPDSNGIDGDTVTKYTNRILGTLSTVGIIASVIGLMIMGLKYVIGSATEKVEYKKNLVPIVVGMLLIAFICGIIRVLVSLGNSINNA